MLESRTKTWRPQDFQLPFVTSTAPYPCRVAPWGDGKTVCAIMMCMALSQYYPGNKGLIVRKKYNALRRSTISDFEDWTGLKVPEHKQEVVLEEIGSKICFSHAENVADFKETLHGMNLGFAYIEQGDELDSAEVFEMLDGRMRRILTPNDQIQDRLIEFGVLEERIPDVQQYLDTLSIKDSIEFQERLEKGIIEKLGLPVRQIIVIANACGHNWIYNRWHPSKNPLPGYDWSEGAPFENEKYIPPSTRRNWEQLKIHAPKKYNRYVLNSHEDYDIEGSYYAALMSDALKDNRVELNTLYDRTVPVYTFWDLGVSDETTIWFVQFVGQSIHLIDYHSSSGKGIEFYSGVLDEKKFGYSEHWLPHDAAQRLQGQVVTTRLDILRRLRPNEDVYVLDRHSVADRIQAVRSLLNKCRFDVKCEDGVECLNKYHREVNQMKSTEEKTVYTDKPAHDSYSHGADSFGYMSVAYRYFLAGRDGMVLGAVDALPARIGSAVTQIKKRYKPLRFFTAKKNKRKVG